VFQYKLNEDVARADHAFFFFLVKNLGKCCLGTILYVLKYLVPDLNKLNFHIALVKDSKVLPSQF